MTSTWYYSKDRRSKIGPVSSERLKQLAESGELARSHFVWKEGTEGWFPAAKVKGLFSQPASNKETPALVHEVPTEEARLSPANVNQVVASWTFGSVLLLFFLAVFIFAPPELPPFKQRMLAFSSVYFNPVRMATRSASCAVHGVRSASRGLAGTTYHEECPWGDSTW